MEVTKSIVRRERMGHIELAVPVAHILFLRNVPSRIAMVIGATLSDVEKVVYFAGYIITKVNEEQKQKLSRILRVSSRQKSKSATDDKTRERLEELMDTAKKKSPI